MKLRLAALAVAAGVGALMLVGVVTRADAQQTICTNSGFATTSGTTACSGGASPVTTTATVTTTAKLTLAQVFGAAASSLTVAFGTIDAVCSATPPANVTCHADSATQATWYGDVQFGVVLSGTGSATAKLTGVRPTAGSIPTGQLVDGVGGAEPSTAYPVSPSAPIVLQTGMGSGATTVTRGFGLVVSASDAAGAWSGNTTYSVVIE